MPIRTDSVAMTTQEMAMLKSSYDHQVGALKKAHKEAVAHLAWASKWSFKEVEDIILNRPYATAASLNSK